MQATPNLRVINMWGVSFVDDSHIEAFSSNCIQLAVTILIFNIGFVMACLFLTQVLCVNYCSKVQGSTLAILVQRCKVRPALDTL